MLNEKDFPRRNDERRSFTGAASADRRAESPLRDSASRVRSSDFDKYHVMYSQCFSLMCYHNGRHDIYKHVPIDLYLSRHRQNPYGKRRSLSSSTREVVFLTESFLCRRPKREWTELIVCVESSIRSDRSEADRCCSDPCRDLCLRPIGRCHR